MRPPLTIRSGTAHKSTPASAAATDLRRTAVVIEAGAATSARPRSGTVSTAVCSRTPAAIPAIKAPQYQRTAPGASLPGAGEERLRRDRERQAGEVAHRTAGGEPRQRRERRDRGSPEGAPPVPIQRIEQQHEQGEHGSPPEDAPDGETA